MAKSENKRKKDVILLFLAGFGDFLKTHPESATEVDEVPVKTVNTEAADRTTDTQPIYVWTFLKSSITFIIKIASSGQNAFDRHESA